MKKLLLTLLLCSVVSVVSAAEYKFIVPNTPGSAPDYIARLVQKSYQRNTKNTLVIENLPGADSIIGINKFKQDPKSIIIIPSGPMVIIPTLAGNTGPWVDSDFDWAGLVSFHPQVWFANKKSGIVDFASLKKYIETHDRTEIGADFIVGIVNATAFFEEQNIIDKLLIVRYKAAPDTVMSVMNETTPLGIGNSSPALLGAIETGKIRPIVASGNLPVQIGKFTVPPLDATGKIYTLSGWQAIAINKKFQYSTEADQLKRDLWAAINDPETRQQIRKLGLISDPVPGDKLLPMIEKQRKNFAQHSDSVKSLSK